MKRKSVFRKVILYLMLASILISPFLQPLPAHVEAAAVHVDNPFTGAGAYINPDYAALVDTSIAKTTDSSLKAKMETVKTYPTAVWLDRIAAIHGGAANAGRKSLADHLDLALAQKQAGVPITATFVIYDLPGRDCAALASNGELPLTAAGLERYKTDYIDAIASVFANPKYQDIRIVTVIEPDGLPNLATNLSDPECAQANSTGIYASAATYALSKLSAIPNVYNYMDISHSGWLGWPDNMQKVVQIYTNVVKNSSKGFQSIEGFVTNAANYTPLEEPFLTNSDATVGGQQVRSSKFYEWNPHFDELDFTKALHTQFVAAGFPSSIGMLIDTSRNGWGGAARPAGASTATELEAYVKGSKIDARNHRGLWCNASGAGMGMKPQEAPAAYAGSHVDALVWVKPPGESDGASSAIPNDEGKSADPMCDPGYTSPTNQNYKTGAMPNAPLAGHWFHENFAMLVANAYPAIPAGGGGGDTVPVAPGTLTATAGNAQALLTWSASSGALSYNVKRSTASGGPYMTIGAGVTGTSYTDTGLTNGTAYYYIVTALNARGEGAASIQASVVPSGGGSSGGTGVVGAWGQLRVEGNKLLNKNGVEVQLAGMSSHGLQWFGNYVNKSTLTWLRDDWKINVFRAAMYTEEGGYLSNPSVKDKVKEAVQTAKELGIYVIIDWHILSDNDPNTNKAQAKAFFQEMAQLYGNDPNVIYEIANEPNGSNVTWSGSIKPYAEEVIPAIRAIDPDGIVVVGTPTWSQDIDKAADNPLSFSNVMYALHFYTGTHGQYLRDRIDYARSKGVAIMATEWGTSEASGNGGPYLNQAQEWVDFLNSRKVSWMNWSLSDKAESSAALNAGASANGNWTAANLTASGSWVRNAIRLANAGNDTTPDPTVPSAPTGLSAVAGDGKVTLSWTASAQATGYTVKRSTSANGAFATVAADVTATAFTDASVVNQTTYYYKVSAHNAVGEGTDSSQASATPKAGTTNPPDPAGKDWLHVSGNQIVDEKGNPVWLTGANWFGFNATERVFHGLWSGNIEEITKSMADRGINIVRVPISTQLLLEWKEGKAATSNNVNTYANPELTGMTTLQVWDYWLELCEQYGLKVVIDVHSAEADNSGHMYPVWYKGSITQEMFYQAWEWVTDRYKNNDTIVAMDLKNEPHGKYTESPRAKWDGSTDADNFKYAAETAAKRILAINPNVLVLVEGIEMYPREGKTWAGNADADYHFNWWGGNLRGVTEFPIELGANQDQLVYSPHDYGPLVYNQPWFQSNFDKTTLTNDVWTPNWFYIHKNNIAPLLIGEWGGRIGQDARQDKWMTALRDFIVEHKLHHTFWCVNPNSGDTGGLLLDDWKTWDEIKYAMLKPALWQEGGKFVSLDHQIRLGGTASTTGLNLTDLYGGEIPDPTVPNAPVSINTTSGDGQATVTWSASNGAASYTVKRSTTNGGPYTVIKAGATGTSFTDSGLANGTTYYYVVSAVNAVGESAHSAQASATPAAVPAPSITALSPATGTPGTLVTISGVHFGTAQGTSSVLFGSAAAAVTAWSDTSVHITVPSLPAGPASVTVKTGTKTSNSVAFTVTVQTPAVVQVSELQLSTLTLSSGGTLTGTATMTNTGGTAITLPHVSITARRPGATNAGGPYDNFGDQSNVTLAPGQSIQITQSRTFHPSEPNGSWYAYLTYQTADQAWHDQARVDFKVGGTVTPPPTGTNLALNKSAVASSVENGGTLAAAAFDGNSSTRWASAFEGAAWLQVDLGAAQSINHVYLEWEEAYAKAYTVQVSTDGTNWQTVYTTAAGDGGTDDLAFAAITARYIRVNATVRSTPYGYSLYEFQVFGDGSIIPPTSSLNLALNKASTASTIENGGTPASAAFDGNASTRWASAFEGSAWLQVDLGASRKLTKVVLEWEAAYAKAYTIQISADGANWQTVYTTANGDGGKDEITFAAVDARYIKMNGTDRATPYGYSLYEFQAFES